MSRRILIHLIVTLAAFALVTVWYFWRSSSSFRNACRRRLGSREQKDDLNEEDVFDPVFYMRSLMIPMLISLLWFFIPMAMRDEGRNNSISSVFDALIRSGQTFSMDSSIQDVWDTAESLQEHFTFWDRVWLSFILSMAPILTAVSAATLFQLPKFWFTMVFSRREICIFSDLNERTKLYAEEMQRAYREDREGKETIPGRKRRMPYIVFCSDGREDEVDTSNLAGQSLVMEREISDIYLTGRARRRTSFYLMTEDDNTVIEQAGKLQKKYNAYASRIICISNGTLNELAIDQLNKNTYREKERKKKDRREEETIDFQNGVMETEMEETAEIIRSSHIEIISEPTRAVFHMLYDRDEQTSLINQELLTKVMRVGQTDQPSYQRINILILGAGSMGEMLARTLLWYCQMPGIGVSVTVAGSEKEEIIRGRICRKNMDFENLLRQIDDGVTSYSDRAVLKILGEVDFDTRQMEQILSGEGQTERTDYHFVFVAAGKDNQSYQLALRVRKHYLRRPYAWGFPKIQAVVWNDVFKKVIGGFDYVTYAGKPCGTQDQPGAKENGDPDCRLFNPKCSIRLLGSMSETLRAKEQMVYDALRYHSYYSDPEREAQLNGENVRIRVKDYLNYYQKSESDERSNWAAVIHGILKYRWFETAGRGEDCGKIITEYRKEIQDGTIGEDQNSLLEKLAETEQIRWCLFKLLEGDAPVREDRLEEFMKTYQNGRDADPIRGYHAAIRTWRDLQQKAERGPGSVKMLDYLRSTRNVAIFSLAMEKSWADSMKEGTRS